MSLVSQVGRILQRLVCTTTLSIPAAVMSCRVVCNLMPHVYQPSNDIFGIYREWSSFISYDKIQNTSLFTFIFMRHICLLCFVINLWQNERVSRLECSKKLLSTTKSPCHIFFMLDHANSWLSNREQTNCHTYFLNLYYKYKFCN